MYSERILEIFKNPTNAGGLQGSQGIGKYIDEATGDYYKIYLKFDETETIIDAHFKTMGSVGAIVASSVLCSELVNLTIEDAKEVNEETITKVTGEYPEDKKQTLTYAIYALKSAIDEYYVQKEKAEKNGEEFFAKAKPQKEKVAKKAAEKPAVEQETNTNDKQVSKAKANFDAMFEAWND